MSDTADDPVAPQQRTQKNLNIWIIVFGLLILAISWGVTLLEIQRDRSSEILRAQREADNLALILQQYVFNGFSQIETSLSSVRQSYESGQDARTLHTLLKHLPDSRPDLFNLISIINPQGEVVLTNQEDWSPTNSGDRPFFIHHRDNPDRRALIGDPLLGRVTGKWYIPVSLRLQDAQGRFAGVLLASVDPGYFSGMFRQMDLGPDGLVYLADQSGQIFSGILGGHELALDRRISPDKAAAILGRLTPQQSYAASEFDGVVRIPGRSFLSDRSMYLSVEIGLDGRLKNTHKRTFVFLLIESAFSIIVIFFLFRLRREIAARDAFSRELLQTGEALRESEEFRRRAFESSPVAVVIMDANTLRYIDCNPAAVKAGGYASKEEMLRQAPDQHADLPQYDGTPSGIKARHYIELAKKEGSVDFEWRHKRPNGELWDASVHLMFFRSGARELMQFTLHDITAQKRVEDELREKDAELQRYFDSSLDLLCIADVAGFFLRLNPEWEKTLGYPLQELEGRRFLDLVHPEDQQATLEAVARLERQEEIARFENRYRCKDGAYRWIEWRSKPIGNLIYAAARDITERKQTEEALKESRAAYKERNETLNTLLNNLSSGVFMVEAPSGRPIVANLAAQRLLGRGILPDCSKENLSEIYRAHKPGCSKAYPVEEMPIIRGIYGETTHIDDMIVERPDGTEIWLEVFGAPVRNEHGQVWASLASFQDITQRKKAEEQLARLNQELEERVQERTAELAQTNRQLQETLSTLQHTQAELVRSERLASLGALVAGVAHELNTPLGNSYTIATTLQEIGKEFLNTFEKGELKRSSLKRYAEQVNEAAGLMSRNLYRASEMIAHFKQVTADQTSAQRRRFELHECVDEILTTLQPQFKRTPHKIVVEVPEGLSFDSYPGPLGQVITNTVLNALMHAFEGRENGIIRIEAVALGHGWVRLTISDNGCGIPAKNLPKIFDPFFTTRLGTGGSGLGLHIVYSIITRVLGGKIDVESGEGKGAVFSFDIPLVAPEAGKDENPSIGG